MGNSNGNIHEYWKAIDSTFGLQGGFIWDWVDQALLKEGTDGCKYWAYGGAFGDTPNDLNFCLNGLTWPDRTPHPALHGGRTSANLQRFTSPAFGLAPTDNDKGGESNSYANHAVQIKTIYVVVPEDQDVLSKDEHAIDESETRGSISFRVEMSSSYYGTSELDKATHNKDLVKGDDIEVHLDHKHMGLGGDDSWSPSVHDQYLVPPVPYSFCIRFCPILPSVSCQDIYRAQLQL
ncbi:hypothetical protein J5N97_012984 [Dioscorea zingiberensis]|uniref:beta-galactosidase n=1 Tax=Dioscorea zingiberensis TaxID=325984 RepID=A0A9D5CQ01_9LILI|nr:hypothetical protein J5N97_012984 [Dioscorea zingiberensis]